VIHELVTSAGNSDKDHQKVMEDTGYWGKRAAGVLFWSVDTRRVLFAHRSRHVTQPGTYGTWGGAIDAKESPTQAVRREIKEETGYQGKYVLHPLTVYVAPDADFRYYSFLASVQEEFTPKLDWENAGFKWAEMGTWPTPLHPGMGKVLDALFRYVS
jgi:8-oxo-dGTP pyrophosphatase MutT (NUDIX family)